MKIKQAVIPAAGLGKRLMPLTKNMPRELMPLYDKPCLQQIIEEAIKAGVEEFVIVISQDKLQIKKYFEPNESLDEWLLENNFKDIHARLKKVEKIAKCHFVIQEELLGLGHAVMCAQPYITENYFFVLLPDDIIDADKPVCQQMAEVFAETEKPIIAVMEVPWDDVHRFGIVKANPLSEKVGDIKRIVEKPKRQQAPSNLAVVGRYLLPKEIFKYIEQTKPSSGRDIELTDAIEKLVSVSGIHSFVFDGERYDAGTAFGLMSAGLMMGLKNPKVRDQVIQHIKILASSL